MVLGRSQHQDLSIFTGSRRMSSHSVEAQGVDAEQERVRHFLALLTSFIFFQACMVAPLIAWRQRGYQ